MSRITDAFTNGPALIPYLTAGDPNPEATKSFVRAVSQGGADIIELGMPFSEPIADGPTIQAAINRSLSAGMTPTKFFELTADIEVNEPLVVMTYYNLVYQFGDTPVESFVNTAATSNISGIIVPDLPIEESESLHGACKKHGLDLIFIVAPTTTDERLAEIMNRVTGFVYVQARLGTTGVQDNLSQQTYNLLSRVTQYDIPKAVGFGVRTGEHAAEIIRAGADGVVAGSVFVDIIAGENREDPGRVSDQLEQKAKELKRGALSGIESIESEGR